MAMIKQKLDISQLNHDFFDDTRILGIMAPVKNYYFIWMLNNFLGFNFFLYTDAPIEMHKKNRAYHFNLYISAQHESSLVHYLYHNQCDGEALLPELKHLDFIWLMKGDRIDDERCNRMMDSIKKIGNVQLVLEIPQEQIKNISNLII
ncbi:IPExxxVDY family protein [Hydrotalea flava]|uniref:IPExxxVDY family protein n=1 Tax=Hydrotalea flava TaxID=714549 RepID=UPI000834BD4D|nr:IPExxxVDY family protein [Hydrotalea flava]